MSFRQFTLSLLAHLNAGAIGMSQLNVVSLTHLTRLILPRGWCVAAMAVF